MVSTERLDCIYVGLMQLGHYLLINYYGLGFGFLTNFF